MDKSTGIIYDRSGRRLYETSLDERGLEQGDIL